MLFVGHYYEVIIIVIHAFCVNLLVLLDLRRAVRSSQMKPSSSTHIHTFPTDQETHNSDDDTWTKTCSSCGYQVTFEKM